MKLLLPFYCPNCKALTFLVKGDQPQLVDYAPGAWALPPCQRFEGKPILEFEIVTHLLGLKDQESFAFKYRPGGHHRHTEPKEAVVLRIADARHPYFQVLTGENGLFEVKLNGALGLVQGCLIGLGKLKRTGTDRFRTDHWEALELPELLAPTATLELYRLTLKAPEQEALETHCTRFLQHFDRAGTPALGVLPGLIQPGAVPLFVRQLFLSKEADLVLALEKVSLPEQVETSFHQIKPQQLHER